MIMEVTVERKTEENKKIWLEFVYMLIKIIVIALIAAITLTFFYGLHRNTETGMFPMIKGGDLVLFNRLDKNYNIGDLLLLDFEGERQIRRVVAQAGDTVDITDDGLIVNRGIHPEPEIFVPTTQFVGGIEFPLTVPGGHVFVLGDARETASDSRIYGTVDTRNTLGTVVTIVWRRQL
jgi:signal peptidase I